MTVSSATNKVQYSPNGVLTTFAYPFRIFAASHLLVVLTSALGVDSILALNTDYTVTGVGEVSGGNIEMTTAPAAGTTLTIVRQVPLLQETDYTDGDNFPAAAHEDALDRGVMMCQQLAEEVGRAMTLPVGTVSQSSAFPKPSADPGPQYIRWNLAHDALEAVTDPTDLTTMRATISGLYKLRATNIGTANPNRQIYVTAAAVLVVDDNGNRMVLEALELTYSELVSGAGGIDFALGTPQVPVYLYVIAKPDGTKNLLGSLSANTPTLPTGYTYKKLISAYFGGRSGGGLVPFYQIDKVVHAPTGWSLFTVAHAAWTSNDISSKVPPVASQVLLQVEQSADFNIACAISWGNPGTMFIRSIFAAKIADGISLFKGYTSPFWYPINPAAPDIIYCQGPDENSRGTFIAQAYELDI